VRAGPQAQGVVHGASGSTAAATGRRCLFVAQQKATALVPWSPRWSRGPGGQAGSPPPHGRLSVPQAARRAQRGHALHLAPVFGGGRFGLCEASAPVRNSREENRGRRDHGRRRSKFARFHARADKRPRRSCPRTRGGGPHAFVSPKVDGQLSPHARGWTALLAQRQVPSRVVPARAGVDRLWRPPSLLKASCPRTRGGGPNCGRTRITRLLLSPHARGWTEETLRGPARASVVPARAGVDRCHARCRRPRTPLSPHARGWTEHPPRDQRQHRVVPARAGVDRGAASATRPRPRCPRTRGGGPEVTRDLEKAIIVVPARAGVDRRPVHTTPPSHSVVPARAGVDRDHDGD
jgi:hypothetical protein